MTNARVVDNATMVKVLCVLVAALLWLSVAAERQGEIKLLVPVTLRLPVGMKLAAPVPDKVEVTVSGPKILLLLLPYRDVSCNINLRSAAPGPATVELQDAFSSLSDKEVKVVQVFPRSLRLDISQ